jgi:hypothetical protein
MFAAANMTGADSIITVWRPQTPLRPGGARLPQFRNFWGKNGLD